jgi:hypothetical protein
MVSICFILSFTAPITGPNHRNDSELSDCGRFEILASRLSDRKRILYLCDWKSIASWQERHVFATPDRAVR